MTAIRYDLEDEFSNIDSAYHACFLAQFLVLEVILVSTRPAVLELLALPLLGVVHVAHLFLSCAVSLINRQGANFYKSKVRQH